MRLGPIPATYCETPLFLGKLEDFLIKIAFNALGSDTNNTVVYEEIKFKWNCMSRLDEAKKRTYTEKEGDRSDSSIRFNKMLLKGISTTGIEDFAKATWSDNRQKKKNTGSRSLRSGPVYLWKMRETRGRQGLIFVEGWIENI